MLRFLSIAIITFGLAVACRSTEFREEPGGAATVPLFTGLGKHTRSVSSIPLAQKYFDQGVNFLFAFNHDEARRAFRQCAELDDQCAMAYWGIAISYGTHINRTELKPEWEKEALLAVREAKLRQAKATEADQALIHAVGLRFKENAPADRSELNAAYSQAMKDAWYKYSQDADIGSLYAESIMNKRPWDLWTNDGKANPGTSELVTTLEEVLKVQPNHPMALHLYIHALEASPEPMKAADAANRLRHLTPGLGHLLHMPSHIDVRMGKWQEAIEANERAIESDAKYRKVAAKQDYYRLYMAHNQHMLAFAAMMTGQSAKAKKAIQTMLSEVPSDWIAIQENANLADGYLATPLEVMMRFGQWEEILQAPAIPDIFPVAKTLAHHARGVAYAALGRNQEARAEQKLFQKAAAATPAETRFGNNLASALYDVAKHMLEGEILYREGKLVEAIRSLRLAVEKEDQLGYMEPPDWIIPVRHPLGAILLSAGRIEEAEKVFHEDLKRWPKNGWSLYGLQQCLEKQGRREEAEAVKSQLRETWKLADVALRSPCKCVEPQGK